MRITNDTFNNKLKGLKEKQFEIAGKISQYTQVDENYYTADSTILNLAQRALEIFNSSEVIEKQQLINFLLQNPQLQGRNLVFALKTTFDKVLEASRCCEMLPSSKLIIILENREHMKIVREKLLAIQGVVM